MEKLDTFCGRISIESLKKVEQAIAFIWFYSRANSLVEVDINQICEVFDAASLPLPNKSRLRDELKSLRGVRKGKKEDAFSLTRETLRSFDEKYGDILVRESLTVADVAGIDQTPFLSSDEIDSARRMAELYVITHCYENSARKLIEATLKRELGVDWWNIAANTPMKNKADQLKQKEQRHKWITPRGISMLFYVDWGDLVTLIRKYEEHFVPVVGDLKFIEIRMEELERYRNIIAHNGTLESKDDYDQIILSFKQWCKQVK
jgi:hypothetical protein